MFDKYTQISVSKEIKRNMYAEGFWRKEPGVSAGSVGPGVALRAWSGIHFMG